MAQITLKDVYDVVNRLEDKIDTNLQDLNKKVDKNFAALDRRISRLEHWQYKTIGFATAIATLIGIVSDYIVRHWHL